MQLNKESGERVSGFVLAIVLIVLVAALGPVAWRIGRGCERESESRYRGQSIVASEEVVLGAHSSTPFLVAREDGKTVARCPAGYRITISATESANSSSEYEATCEERM